MSAIAMEGADDRSFVIDAQDGPMCVVISAALLRTFAGRSNVTVTEVLDIYRSELEDAARAKAKRSGSRSVIRLEAPDLSA